MKFTKSQRNNLFFFIVLALVLFTPIGKMISVQLNALKVAFSNPSTIAEENRVMINSYEWKITDADQNIIDFKKYKGEVILLNFWATWCPPCVAEMPSLQKLHADYGDKIRFVFVANDEKKKVNEYLADNGYDLPVYYALSKAPKEIYSKSIPATFLIDVDGNIVMKEIGSSDWNSENVRNQIDELLAFSLAE